jgi:hypothetical protein
VKRPAAIANEKAANPTAATDGLEPSVSCRYTVECRLSGPNRNKKSTASCETTSARRADGDITVASGSCAAALAGRADLS